MAASTITRQIRLGYGACAQRVGIRVLLMKPLPGDPEQRFGIGGCMTLTETYGVREPAKRVSLMFGRGFIIPAQLLFSRHCSLKRAPAGRPEPAINQLLGRKHHGNFGGELLTCLHDQSSCDGNDQTSLLTR